MKKNFWLITMFVLLALVLVGCASAASPEESAQGGANAERPEVVVTQVVEAEKPADGGFAPPMATSVPGAAAGEDAREPASAPSGGYSAFPTATPPVGSTSGAYTPVTAGMVDDNERWDEYLRYWDEKYYVYAFRRDVSERHIILIEDQSGQPVHDAAVTVYDGANAIFNGRTDAGGRVLFHPRALSGGQSTYFYQPGQRLQLTYSKGQASRTATLTTGQSETVEFVLPGAPIAARAQLDLVFLMDATGSMGDEIDKLKANMAEIANQVSRLPQSPAIRYALVAYRDLGDAYVVRTYDFTSDLDRFQDTLNALEANGGGDYPESLNQALNATLYNLSWTAQDAVRMVILVADAPPHLDYNEPYTYDQDMGSAVSRGIKLFPVGASGLDEQAEFIFRQLAQYTGGKFVFLTYADASNPSSGPGGETTTSVETYSVGTLDRLVVKLITDELDKLPDPALSQGQGQGYANPGLDPNNPVWYVPNPGFAPLAPNAWYLNSDFANGLESWWVGSGSAAGTVDSGTRWDATFVQNADDRSGVVELWRTGGGGSTGSLWLEQLLDVDVRDYASLQLKASLKVISHSLPGSGWFCDTYVCEGEYPLRFSLYYQAADGQTYMWSWGFLTGPNPNTLQNYNEVRAGEWFDYTSPNLLNLNPRPVKLLGVRLAAAGADFYSQVDRVDLELTMP